MCTGTHHDLLSLQNVVFKQDNGKCWTIKDDLAKATKAALQIESYCFNK